MRSPRKKSRDHLLSVADLKREKHQHSTHCIAKLLQRIGSRAGVLKALQKEGLTYNLRKYSVTP